VKVAYSDKKVGISGSKVLFMEAPDTIQCDGGYLNTLGGGFCPSTGRKDKLDQKVRSVGFLIGCALLIKKEVFNQIGGFDDEYFMYGEEGDLTWRTWLYGYSVKYVPTSIVYYKGGGSSKDLIIEKEQHLSALKKGFLIRGRLFSLMTVYHGNKNSLTSIIKNFEYKNMLIGLTFSFVYILFQLMLLIVDKKGNAALFLLKSPFCPIRNFRSIWKKRLIVQKGRRISDNELFRKGVMMPLHNLLKIVVTFD